MGPLQTNSFHVVIVSPDETIFEGECLKMIVPTIYQDIAILPDHTPLYAQIKNGTIIITQANGSKTSLPVEGGMVRVKRNQVSIIIGFDTRETLFKA